MIYADDISNSSIKRPQLKDITAGTATGAAIGLVGGVLYAFFNKKGYLECMTIGTLAGGLLSNIFIIR